MNETAKYMTMEECKKYRELAAKPGAFTPAMSMSFPCYQLDLKAKIPTITKEEMPFAKNNYENALKKDDKPET
jgi:hypothetical protein